MGLGAIFGTVVMGLLTLAWLAFFSPKVEAQITTAVDSINADTLKIEQRIDVQDGRIDTLDGKFQYIMGQLDAIATAVNAKTEE